MTSTLASRDQNAAVSTWRIDPSHSLVEFGARHLMITTVKGRLSALDGALTLDELDPGRSSVEVTFQSASVDTRSDQRDEHLRSADFLDVARFPAITFRSSRIEAATLVPGERFTVAGDLTIRDVTREVVLDATFEGRGPDPWGGERMSFSARTTIDRRPFGLTWNTTLETGGLLVGNDIRIEIEVQAVRDA